MLVPFGIGPVSEATPIMASTEAQEVSGINRELWELAGRIEKFVEAHYYHIRARNKPCAFCALYPHAVEFLNMIQVGYDMQAEYLLSCRPLTTEEFKEQQIIFEEPPAMKGGA